MGIENLSPFELNAHPRNSEIYGANEDVSDLVLKIRESKWVDTLVVSNRTGRHVIISGHRRWLAALQIGLETVPVEVRSFATEEAELETLLLYNVYREKTPEVCVREGDLWSEVETAKAKARQGTRTDLRNIPANLPECSNGETREKLSAKAGMRPRTFDKARTVVRKSDTLKAQGKEKEADTLLGILNNQSVDAAYKVVKAPEEQVEKILEKIETGAAKNVKDAIKKTEREERQRAAALSYGNGAGAVSGPIPKAGELWRLGRHTLYCGDTSERAFIERAPVAAFAFADPPYNAGVAAWDNDFKWGHDWLIERAGVVAVTPGIVSIFEFARVTQMPYLWSVACWIDNGMTRGAMGFGNWLYAALFSKSTLHRGIQDHFRVSIKTSETEETEHKGRKPAEFVAWLMQHYSQTGEIVIDPFLGSGTTLLVAESMGRTCYGGELNPAYCAAIIARWEQVTGLQAEREE